MKNIVETMRILRKNKPFLLDNKNSNPYRLIVAEADGSKTAYYFSAPIYNHKTRKVVDMKFHADGENIYAAGSNAAISIKDFIRMENEEGFCKISLAKKARFLSAGEAASGYERIYPTTNGVAIRCFCRWGNAFSFTMETKQPFLKTQGNDKYFSVMSEKFRPFVTVSCIGTADAKERMISPAAIHYQNITDREYRISVSPGSALGVSVLFEINLYEPKLFQDTTVESENPGVNNAFGSMAFIGRTKAFGEQWLYTRADRAKLEELYDKTIRRAILHLPKWNDGAVELTALQTAARFCSFGSTWENKIDAAAPFSDSQIADRYMDLDFIAALADKQGRLSVSEGVILRAKTKNTGFSAISTGDNSSSPQILEINYI